MAHRMFRSVFVSSVITQVSKPSFADGDDDGGDGGGDGKSTADQIAEAVEAAVGPLKTKNEELLKEKKKASESATKYSALLDSLGGEDGLKQLRDFQSTIEKDETMKAIKEGRWEEVVEKKTTAMRDSYEKQLDAERTKLSELEKERDGFRSLLQKTHLETAVRKATGDSEGFQPPAVEDALVRAGIVFNGFDEATKTPVIHDEDGNPVLGKDGRTPKTVNEWLEEQKESARHWWASSQGSGAGGQGTSSAGAGDLSQVSDQSEYERRRAEQQKERNRF